MSSVSNNTLLFCFIFVNKHRVLACDSLLTIETSKQEGNSHGRARGLRLLRWGIFLVVYLGDDWESLKQLFSTPFFFFLRRCNDCVFQISFCPVHVKFPVFLSVWLLFNIDDFLMTWGNPVLSRNLFQTLWDHSVKVIEFGQGNTDKENSQFYACQGDRQFTWSSRDPWPQI